MHINMGNLDRVVRALIAVAALIVALVVGAGYVAGIVLLVVTALMGVTAAVGYCPLYSALHLDSRGRKPLPH